jgi:hypothetical protein
MNVWVHLWSLLLFFVYERPPLAAGFSSFIFLAAGVGFFFSPFFGIILALVTLIGPNVHKCLLLLFVQVLLFILLLLFILFLLYLILLLFVWLLIQLLLLLIYLICLQILVPGHVVDVGLSLSRSLILRSMFLLAIAWHEIISSGTYIRVGLGLLVSSFVYMVVSMVKVSSLTLSPVGRTSVPVLGLLVSSLVDMVVGLIIRKCVGPEKVRTLGA